MQGLILNGSKNVFEVECEDGITRDCPIKGKILKESDGYYNPIAPGDIVTLDDETLEEFKGQITGLVPRKNEFVRFNIKKRQPQLLAANLDYLLIVTTPDEPPFRPRFIDRALAQAEYQNITPVIVCNKYDLPAAKDEDFQTRLSIWEDIGYKVIRSSARTREGMEELANLIENHLSALVGQSGVGKSSLINVLDNNVVLKTGSLSQKYGRGTHTTTKGSLMHIQLDEALMGGRKGACANIIDTPGVRRFILHDISADNLALYFRDFKEHLGKCAFGMSCSHLTEKGCAIKQAVEEGTISAQRYDSWKRISDELKNGSWED
ncbi:MULTISPECIES: ribosome small subunit-dependent GTPase A [Treponema]|uniref:Small ribosomal subunit biogenesis GTPase RsgA n=1 Tax=Treponema peruense TaxID=2787628 RepID=A0A7T3REY6_9SPIR|nr:ribosome small subunit-dependent GTPase A [Treponema peruense]QQA01773.1 ribosome small subunit-dependent GTPase A [Treponema peruense]